MQNVKQTAYVYHTLKHGGRVQTGPCGPVYRVEYSSTLYTSPQYQKDSDSVAKKEMVQK